MWRLFKKKKINYLHSGMPQVRGKKLEGSADGTMKETGRRRRLEGNISVLSRQPVSQLLISRAGASSVNHGTTGAACTGATAVRLLNGPGLERTGALSVWGRMIKGSWG